MIRPACLALALTILVCPAAWSQGGKLMPYPEVRALLQRLGYDPYLMPGSDICDPADPRCYPELESCASARTWSCTYTWRRGRSIIEVGTQYDHPLVTRSACIVNCTRVDIVRPRGVRAVAAAADE